MAGFVGILAVLPAANAAGIAVGDMVVVNGPVARTFINVVDLAGVRTWSELTAGAGQPDAFGSITFTQGAPASQRITVSGAVVDAAGQPVDGALVNITVTGTAANLAAAAALTGTVADARDLSPTSSSVVMQCAANGLFSVALDWGAAEAATQVAQCGAFAIGTAALAFP